LIDRTGSDPGSNWSAHHIFPQASRFSSFFGRFAGFNIHDPQVLCWWNNATHYQFASEYNAAWQAFIDANPSATFQETMTFARTLIVRYAQQVGGDITAIPKL